MKLCLNASWEQFEEESQKQKEGIILFGASSCADVFLNRLKTKYNVKYFVDNDDKKQGKKWEYKYDIFSPEKLEEEGENELLLVTSTYHKEIIEQLKQIGFKGSVYYYLHLRNKVDTNVNAEVERKNIEKLKEILFDEKSKDIVDKIYQKRIFNIEDFSDIEEENQYFVDGIINRDDEAVFIDGGAYDGETVSEFVKFQNNKFAKVYSFEMDKENFAKINKTTFDDRVHFLNYGLWNKKQTMSFIASCRGSEIAEEGNSVAECVALDDVINKDEKVTFIKMDIEGAEQNALLGAKRIITDHKPQLAICLYHSFSDLWEIPFMIHDMVPEYKLYIRHHSESYQETVLYAVI